MVVDGFILFLEKDPFPKEVETQDFGYGMAAQNEKNGPLNQTFINKLKNVHVCIRPTPSPYMT